MGKSDGAVFSEYRRFFVSEPVDSVAFLGFNGENAFTQTIVAPGRSFFDRQLGNWDINSSWKLDSKYDILVCTRCPYFAIDPEDFIQRCYDSLNDGGRLFIDWGLGDHWRFGMYKVGWVRAGEHEFAYGTENFLYSCHWRPEYVNEPEVISFWDRVRGRYGYGIDDDLTTIIRAEVPKIVDYHYDEIRFKHLWDDNPQLYIMTKSTR